MVLLVLFLACDYIEGMWKMLQQDKVDDFMLGTREIHPVCEFVKKSSRQLVLCCSLYPHSSPLLTLSTLLQ